MEQRTRKYSAWVIAIALLVGIAGVYFLYRSCREEVRSRRTVLIERGQTTLDALAAGTRAHGRMGRYIPERLAAIFEELASTPQILGLQLTTPDGTVISSGGDVADVPGIAPGAPFWQGDRLIMAAKMDLLAPPGPPREDRPYHGPGRGRGRARGFEGFEEEWVPFPGLPHETKYTLTAVLDTTDMFGLIRRDRVRFAVSSVVLLAAVTLGALAFLLRVKRLGLEADLARAQERAAHQEQIARLGAGLTHETKNPLGIVRGLAQSITDTPQTSPEVKKLARDIVDEVDRTVGQINSFLALARPKEPVLAPVDLDAFFERLLTLSQADANAASNTIAYAPTGIRILADEELLRRALLNLLLNALRASRPGATVTVETEQRHGTLAVIVSDTGCGIPREDLPHVTEPYFTRFEGGCGLGLTIVEQIAKAHGWTLGFESAPGAGTRVFLDGIREVE